MPTDSDRRFRALDAWEAPLHALDRRPSWQAVPLATAYMLTTGPIVLGLATVAMLPRRSR